MSNRRSRFEIYVDILVEIMEGSHKPTRIMYGANISYKTLQQILESMCDQGLIKESTGSEKDKRTKFTYELTTKAVNVVRYYSKAKNLLEIKSPSDLS